MKIAVLKNNQPLSEAVWPDAGLDDGFEAFIGRSEDCHVRVPDPVVSRHLAVLRREGAGWVVERLSSASPLALNGNPIDGPVPVHKGDMLTFAPYAVVFAELPATSTPVTHARPETKPVQTLAAVEPAVEPESPSIGDELLPASRDDLVSEVIVPDDLPADDLPAPLDEELGGRTVAEETPAPFTTLETAPEGDHALDSHPVDDLSFGGEEDVIGSSPQDHVEPEKSPDTDGDIEGFNTDMLPDQVADPDALEPAEGTQLLQKFVTYELQLFGEYAPYDLYRLDRPETLIGRDPTRCQIVLNDSEVSSVHAVLRKGLVSLTVEDLNSSNGTMLNGQRVNKAELNNGDELVIGSTTLTVTVHSDLLQAESGRLMPVQSGQMVERIEEVEEDAPPAETDFSDTGAPVEKSVLKRIWKDPKKRRIAMVVGVLLLVVFLMEDETPPPTPTPQATTKKTTPTKPGPAKRQLSPEEIRNLEARYKIAEAFVKEKRLDEALVELQQIMAVDPDYKNAKTLHRFVQEQNAKLKEEQERLRMEEARAKVREQVKGLLAEAKQAVSEHNVVRSEKIFGEILAIDPENLEVTPLRQELEAWIAQSKAEAEEKARRAADRKRMVDALGSGKAHYLRKEWYKALTKLDEFLGEKGMDEDLIKEASEMRSDARAQLAAELAPLLGKARSLKEGQDLKSAYEAYLDVLRVDPVNAEALNEVDTIRAALDTRSKKVYREAIISESLSLFSDAKEKLQEVQQISPTDSEYYKKATEKLKDYLE